MKKAVIYVRGNKTEMQELFCRIYASDKKYKVLFVTSDIKAVSNCDVLLVSSPSRISREQIEYYEIVNDLKEAGIEVEVVAIHDNAVDYLSLAKELLK